MKRIVALLVGVAILIIPGVASAASAEFGVLLNTGQYQDSHHWQFHADNSSTITPGDPINYIVAEQFGYILMKGGGTDWVGFGSITNGNGTSQFFVSSFTTHFTCQPGYTKFFQDKGCIGTPDLWGLGTNKLITYEQDFYPQFPPTYPDMWEFWVEDYNGTFHGIATMLDMTGTYTQPHVSASMVYSSPAITYPDISVYFSHPFTWQGGGPGWIEWPSASSLFSVTSPLDAFMCPGQKAILRLPDHRAWMVANGMISTSTVTAYCTNNWFFP